MLKGSLALAHAHVNQRDSWYFNFIKIEGFSLLNVNQHMKNRRVKCHISAEIGCKQMLGY